MGRPVPFHLARVSLCGSSCRHPHLREGIGRQFLESLAGEVLAARLRFHVCRIFHRLPAGGHVGWLVLSLRLSIWHAVFCVGRTRGTSPATIGRVFDALGVHGFLLGWTSVVLVEGEWGRLSRSGSSIRFRTGAVL